MLTLVSVVHILIAIMLITLVLVQDSKGGGAGGVLGSSGSNSLLGATGATSLFEKMTRWIAIGFALTCILLSVLTVQNNASVVDTYQALPKSAIPVLPESDTPSAPPAQPSAPAEAPTK